MTSSHMLALVDPTAFTASRSVSPPWAHYFLRPWSSSLIFVGASALTHMCHRTWHIPRSSDAISLKL